MRITESQLRQIIREELHEMKALPPGPAMRRPTLNPHDKAGMERLAQRYQSMWDDPEFSDDDEDGDEDEDEDEWLDPDVGGYHPDDLDDLPGGERLNYARGVAVRRRY